MIVLRRFKEDDRPFIVDSYCQSYFGAPAVRGMTRDDFFPAFKRKANELIDRSEVLVVAAEDDEDTILGWAMFEGSCLHYVYCKKELRGEGVARALVTAVEPDCYSHRSNQVRQVPDGWHYRPDLAW